jgi:hypothetical protein
MHLANCETNLSSTNIIADTDKSTNSEYLSMSVLPVEASNNESLSDLIQQQKYNAEEITVLTNYLVTTCTDCSNKIPISELNKHLNNCPETIMELKVKCDISDDLSFFARRKLIEQKNILSQSWRTNNIIKYANLKSGDKLISFYMYEKNNHGTTPSLEYQNVSIKLNDQLQLQIIKTGDIKALSNISKMKHIDGIKDIPQRLTTRYDRHADLQNYEVHLYREISKATRSYIIRVCAYFSSISWFPVCQHELSSLHSIELLENMYAYNKENVSRSYIDLVEFFTDHGLRKLYEKKYGDNINWSIEVIEKSSNDGNNIF